MESEPARYAEALAAQAAQLLDSVRQEPPNAPEDLSRTLLPMAADLRKALLALRETCETLGATAPRSIHNAPLRSCADDLAKASAHWTAILVNASCLGVE